MQVRVTQFYINLLIYIDARVQVVSEKKEEEREREKKRKGNDLLQIDRPLGQANDWPIVLVKCEVQEEKRTADE